MNRLIMKILHSAVVIVFLLGMIVPAGEVLAAPPTPTPAVATNVGQAKFTLQWLSPTPITGWIEVIGSPTNLTVYDVRGPAVVSQTHYVTVTGRDPATLYYYDVISGGARDDNGGAHYRITTGSSLNPPATDAIYGQVFKLGGTIPAAGTIVFIRTAGAQMLSSLVDSLGWWNINLGEIRIADNTSFFSYSGTTQLTIDAKGAADGTASQTIPVSSAKPAPTMVLADTNAPFVLNTLPPDGATKVPVVTPIKVFFSESMNPSTVQGAFSITPTVSVTFSWSDNVSTFTPAANLNFNTTYTVTISTAAKDLAGIPLAQNHVWSFTTIVPPAVTTLAATNKASRSATLNGNLDNLGDFTSANVSFRWWKSPEPPPLYITDNQTKISIGAFSADIMGLDPDTVYYFDTMVSTENITRLGTPIQSFRTLKEIKNLDVNPKDPVIKPGPKQFTATGNFTDNTPTGDITTAVNWHSSNTSVATIGLHTGTALGLAEGRTIITAWIMTESGNVSSSTNLTVDNTPPSVTVIYPNGGERWGGGKPVWIQWAAWDANMANNPITLEYSPDNGTTWVLIRANVVNHDTGGSYDFTAPLINTSNARVRVTAVDKAGNTASDVSDGPFTIDSTRPTITGRSPAPSATNVPVTTNITVTFSEPMCPTSTQSAFSLTASPAVQGTISWNTDNTTLTFTPDNLLDYFTTYTVTVSMAATDYLSGNNLTQAYSWTFKTMEKLEYIKVTPVNPTVPWGKKIQFNATGTLTSLTKVNLTDSVNWTSSNQNVATISPTGFAESVDDGQTTIRAEIQTPDGPLSDSTNLTVNPRTLAYILIRPQNPQVPVGKTVNFTATGIYSSTNGTDSTTTNATITDNVTWKSSNTDIATIANNGTATAIAVGSTSAVITAQQGDIVGKATLTVTSAVLEHIKVTPKLPSIPLGRRIQFSATGNFSDNTTGNLTTSVTWTSSNTTVAGIGANTGLAQSLATGTTTITATIRVTSVTGVVKDLSDTANLTVRDAEVAFLFVTPDNPRVPQGMPGQYVQFRAIAYYTNGVAANWTNYCTWESTNPAAATMDATIRGKANIVGGWTGSERSTLIKASRTTDRLWTDNSTLTVTEPTLESIEIVAPADNVTVGGSLQLVLTGTYSDGNTEDLAAEESTVWDSKKLKIAEVSRSGNVTGIAIGDVTITATNSGLKDDHVLKVIQAPKVIASAAFPVGDNSSTLHGNLVSLGSAANATVAFEWGLTEAYGNTTDSRLMSAPGPFSSPLTGLSSNTLYYFRAKAEAAGFATVNSTGQTFRTSSTPPTVATKAASSVTNNSSTLNGVLVNLGNALSASVSFEYGLTQAYGSVTDPLQVVSGNNTTVTASISGLLPSTTYHFRVKAVGNGVSYGDDMTFQTGRELSEITITPADTSVPAGKSISFTATGRYTDNLTAKITDNVTWASGDTGIATIQTKGDQKPGQAEGLALGSTTISAQQGQIIGRTTLTVTLPVLESISVTADNLSIPAGRTTKFTATGNFSDNKTRNITNAVTWTSSDTSVASIAANGLATSYKAGPTVITATLGRITGSATLQVGPRVLDRIIVVPTDPTIFFSIFNAQGMQFQAIGIYSDRAKEDITTSVVWSDNETSVSVSTSGLATAPVALTATTSVNIIATMDNQSGNSTLTVTAATLQSITISPASATTKAGRQVQFNATGNYNDGTTANLTRFVNWSSSDNTVAKVNAFGVATTYAQGSTNITASSGSKTSNNATLTVNAAVLDYIKVTPAKQEMSFVAGEKHPFQFKAHAHFSDTSKNDITESVNWTSSNIAVASIGRNTGLATIEGPGSTNITATYGDYTDKTLLTVHPDRKAPRITLTSPTEGTRLSATALPVLLTVSGSVDEPEATTVVIVNGEDITLPLDEDGNFSKAVPLNARSNSIRVEATDLSLNTGRSGTVNVIVDLVVDPATARPNITMTQPDSGLITNNSTITVAGTISGNFTSPLLIVNKNTRRPLSPNGDGSFSANITLVEGENIIVVIAYTSGFAGNKDYLGTSGVIKAILDTEPPVVTVTSPVSGSVVNTPACTVSGTIDDPFVEDVEIIANNSTPLSAPVIGGIFSENITLIPNFTNEIIVRATDKAGNTSPDQSPPIKITVDNTYPRVTLTAPENNIWTNVVSQTVAGTVDDPWIKSATVYLNGVALTKPVPVTEGSFSTVVSLARKVEANTIEVRATDEGGNIGSSGVVNVTLDEKDPKITIGLSDPTDSITITVTSDEPLIALPTVTVDSSNATANVTMTNTDVNTWAGTFAPLPPDKYTVTASGTDRAGNTGTSKANFSKKKIDVDGVKPTRVSTATGGTTTLDIETFGYVTDADVSVTQHLFNPSGNVGAPESAEMQAGIFVEIVVSPILRDNLKQIYIRVDYHPDELPAGIDESTLKLYLWDVASGKWQPEPTSTPHPAEDFIDATIDHLSKYGSFGNAVTPETPTTTTAAPGGGGGGAPPPVTLTGLSAAVPLKVDVYGVVQETSRVKTLDEKAYLDFVKGTKLLTETGDPIGSLSANKVTPTSPTERAILSAYDFGPSGAKFEPAISLVMMYDLANLPKDAKESELYIAYWDGTKWVALESTVDTTQKKVTAKISHFTQFALMAKLPPAPPTVPVTPPSPPALAPASFTISGLSITPSSVKPAEQVTISAVVANIGGSEGKYTVVLKINGVEEARKEVTLGAGKSETVSFSVKKDAEGTYSVEIDGQIGQFTVTIPTQIEPPVKPVNWGLIWGIIAGVIVLGIILWLAVFRRKAKEM